MKYRDFIYVGEPVPELSEHDDAEFLMNIQRSIILALEKRNLLTMPQRENCLLKLEKWHGFNKRK